MTAPSDGLLFDVTASPTPVVDRLLRLADQYVQHNDAMDRYLIPGKHAEPDAHAESARALTAGTGAALHAVLAERLYEGPDLSHALLRLRHLAFLSNASTEQSPQEARRLTALAPADAVDIADTVAREIRRRSRGIPIPPVSELVATHRSALREIACGHIAVSTALGRQYVHCHTTPLRISALRKLESNGLIERAASSTPSVYAPGGLEDRIRLTAAGTTALASALGNSPVTRPDAVAAPAPATVSTPTRTR
ncbi:hypothetical protein AB0L33_28885 [Streptomyces sp. NPDC052299]|uniref:hypothetical protein n=1 Tax=Streptomyces sp. NPDC052299 TaxID=3155054 RepID=UPI00341D03D9